MSAADGFDDRPSLFPSRLSLIRWGGSLLLVLGAHAGVAAGMLAWRIPMEEASAPPPAAVMLDLAPLPKPEPAPAPTPAPEPPPPLESMLPEPESPPEPIVEPEPLPEPPPVKAEVALPEPPKPAPKPKPKDAPKPALQHVEHPKPQPATKPVTETASTAAPASAAPAAAPAPSPAAVSTAMPNWQGLVLGHLERHKRYPRTAQARRQEGVAQLHVTLDRQGRVLSARLVKSAGHTLLDEEALAMVERASPLPPPPPEVPRSPVELLIPVQFFLR
ncbi:energy transducer TonB [Azospirillum sp. sgz302134]